MTRDESQNVPLGAAALLVEIALLMTIAAFAKAVSENASVAVILLFRYMFCLPLLLLFGVLERGRSVFKVADSKSLALRTAFGSIGLLTWLMAVSMIELTKATAISQTLPVFITVLAPLILGERVGLRRWVAVFAGLAGVVVILRPDTDGWLQPGIIYALAAPFFAALMFIYLRKLGRSDSPSTTTIWYNLFGTAAYASWCLFFPVEWPILAVDFYVLVGCGLLASVQQFLMAFSHKLAPASTLAPLHYFAVPISIGIGVLVFDESIGPSFLVGTAIIVASTYYIFLRQRAIQHKVEQRC